MEKQRFVRFMHGKPEFAYFTEDQIKLIGDKGGWAASPEIKADFESIDEGQIAETIETSEPEQADVLTEQPEKAKRGRKSLNQ